MFQYFEILDKTENRREMPVLEASSLVGLIGQVKNAPVALSAVEALGENICMLLWCHY